MPRVRVVIPTYNRAHVLGAAIESVFQQTYSDWEIVVVDDGSTDNTSELMEHLQGPDHPIRYRRQARSGVAAARNAALEVSGEYEYVAFLDSDDRWLKDHLKECVDVLQREPEVGLIFARIDVRDARGHVVEERQKRRNEAFERFAYGAKRNGKIYVREAEWCRRNMILNEFGLPMAAVVVRRTAMRGTWWFDENLTWLVDCDLFLRLACQGVNFAGIDGVHAVYGVGEDNITRPLGLGDNAMVARQRSMVRYAEVKLERSRAADEEEFVRKELCAAAYVLAQCYGEQGRGSEARRWYRYALRHGVEYRILRGFLTSMVPKRWKERIRGSAKAVP